MNLQECFDEFFDSGRRVMVADIQRATAVHFGLTVGELISESRAIQTTRPRQVAIYLTKKLTLRSLPEIARLFRRKCHSTIRHAVSQIEDMIDRDPALRAAVEALASELTR